MVRQPWRPKVKASSRVISKIVAYLRVSTSDQADNGYGLEAQRDQVLAYAQVRGWEVVAVEVDAGISGTLPVARRSGLSSALARVDRGDADALLVSELSRMGRSPAVCTDVFDRLDRAGASFVSIGEPELGSAMLRGLFIGLASDERTRMLERMSAGRLARIRRGGVNCRPCYGYVVADAGTSRSRFDVVPDEASIVRRIFDERSRGFRLRQIVDGLNGERVPTPSGRGIWSAATVCRILDNQSYRGVRRWREGDSELLIAGAIPAILDALSA